MDSRCDPAYGTDERTTLVAFLDWYRATLAMKVDGLTDAQAATAAVPPSILTLTGLVRHLAEVERTWFQRCFAGLDAPPLYYDDVNRDGDLEVTATTSLDEAVATWQAQIAESVRITAACRDLDQRAQQPRPDGVPSMRWILVHMIEEYARHCGHADLLRELIDGAVGD